MRYIIVGNGVAGTTAALHIRRRDRDGEITIISDETLPFYSRIRLIEYLAGAISEDDLVIFKDTWYAQNRIALMRGVRVISARPSDNQLTLNDGHVHGYDRLLLATGGRPDVPLLAAADKKGVFTLRTISDALRLLDYIANRESVIVLGGGVLGIEIANALLARGKVVTIIEVSTRLLPRQTDYEGAQILRQMLEARGIVFHVGTKAREVAGISQVEGVILERGEMIRGDAVIMATGIQPDVALAATLGLTCTAGIPVNDRMETAVPGVFAAGDAASHRGVCYGTWQSAEKQGQIAGINMAGGDVIYTGTIPSHILKVAGIQLLAAGDIDPDDRLTRHVKSDPLRGVYRKLVTDRGRLVGCILLGDLSGRKEILAAIDSGRPLDTLRDTLIN